MELGPRSIVYYIDTNPDGTSIKQLEYNMTDIELDGRIPGWQGKLPGRDRG
jgi:hypothetical protein